MKMLEFDSRNMFGTDGSGNQKKIWIDNKHLVKVNSKLREASKEVDACKLAELFGLNHANYKEIKVLVDGIEKNACITENYLGANDSEITMCEILDSLNVILTYKMSAVEVINIVINSIVKYTDNALSQQAVTFYIYSMMLFDFLICNDDRHLNNFGLIYNEKTKQFRFAPLYDHGETFFRTDATLTMKEYETKVRRFKSKPFSTNQVKNLGDLSISKQVFLIMLKNLGSKQKIIDSDIKEGYKLTIIRQFNKLCDLFNIKDYC